MSFKQTPSQTIGPFFAYGLTPKQYGYNEIKDIASNDLNSEGAIGERISIEGIVFDGNNEPVDDALIEIWQASSSGLYVTSRNLKNTNDSFAVLGDAAQAQIRNENSRLQQLNQALPAKIKPLTLILLFS